MSFIVRFVNDEERVLKVRECALDRSILERFSLFLESFPFLEKDV